MTPRLEKLFGTIETQRQSLLFSVKNMPREKRNDHPAGKWSINQIISHLITAERLSVQYLNKKILGVSDTKDTGVLEEVKMILLIISQRLPLKFKAPGVVTGQTSKETDFDKLVEQWDQTRRDVKALLDRVEEQHVNRKIYKHVWLGMMNVKHALKFFREHVNHHTPQIKRLA
jgi:hypothetical protein